MWLGLSHGHYMFSWWFGRGYRVPVMECLNDGAQTHKTQTSLGKRSESGKRKLSKEL